MAGDEGETALPRDIFSSSGKGDEKTSKHRYNWQALDYGGFQPIAPLQFNETLIPMLG